MDKYLYLVLDVIAILFPLLFSFYPKAPFYRQWKYVWISIALPAIPFIIWDELFTAAGIWGFNPRYLTGIYLGNLPLEEILFFICIPYACTFTYFALRYLIRKDYFGHFQNKITATLIIAMSVVGAWNYDRLYTVITFILLAAFLTLMLFVTKPSGLGRFYLIFLFILIPFFIINGILTGSFIEEEVVWYNDNENLGIRMGTIPIEDVFYGMLLLCANVMIFEWLRNRNKMRDQRRQDI